MAVELLGPVGKAAVLLPGPTQERIGQARDGYCRIADFAGAVLAAFAVQNDRTKGQTADQRKDGCLLYTSDAADE